MSADLTVDYGDTRLIIVVTDPPYFENCCIVQDIPSGEQVIIDPGSAFRKILDAVREAGGAVKEILLTHGHPDHVGAVRALQEELRVPCRVHRAEAPMLDNIADYARRRLGMEVVPPLSYETFAEDGRFELGGKPFRMIATPGHTPGGVCYAFGDGFAVTGDTLFNHGIGRTDLPGGNGPQLVQSLTRLLAELPAEWDVHCGHGPGWTVAEARPWWKAMSGGWAG